ncbi:hypothetical protein [Nocardia sp. BMG51109]|uniref:hypothetical protein n=1 Tax=Nocardia sp. BMG51109 TaxID=1056816 RepID=UPI000463C320|nr:hypothetical protein [Nocardia sp. BMG51109]
MIAMASYISSMSTGFAGVEVEYRPERRSDWGSVVDPGVLVRLKTDSGNATMGLSIEDARSIAEALPQVLMLHDAAVRLAADCAVDEAVSAAVDEVGKAA